MINIAHASTLERAKLQIKKLRKQKAKKKEKEAIITAEMNDEEREEYFKNKNTKSLKDKVMTSLWDYNHNQYPAVKHYLLANLLNERLKEIDSPQNQFEAEEVIKIKRCLDAIFE